MPHTPGPWVAFNGMIAAAGVGSIAHVERRNPNRRDDARLIAAAPDMLEALLVLKRSQAQSLDAYAAALAAIELATGEKS